MFSWLEKNPFFFAVAVFVVIAYAGIVEILPNFADRARPIEGAKPYTVLQLAGRHVYISDGCNACHTQMIRKQKLRVMANTQKVESMHMIDHIFGDQDVVVLI